MKNIVVVLGAGRSGTSLLMNLIADLGVSVSDNLVGPNETNKRGAFEDQDILNISRGILRHYNRNGSALSFLPMPDNWLSDDFTISEREKLKEIVKSQTAQHDIWGFKEPVTAKLLPLWHEVFEQLDLTPAYFLSLRHPSSVSKSFKKAYGVPENLSSLIWISRYCDAVLYTDGDLYVYDYDEWFANPVETLSRLADDLPLDVTKDSLSSAIKTIDVNLRTSGLDVCGNRQALSLYNSIIEYRNGSLPKSSLMDAVHEAREYLSQYEFFSYSVDFMERKNEILFGKLDSKRRELADLKSKLRDLELRHSDPFLYIRKKRVVPYENTWKVCAGVASFKPRERVFKESILSVKDQFDHIYVYLNGYGEVPEYLDDPKFTVYRSEDFCDLSANGKVFSLGQLGSCYFFTLDDDILYPDNYVYEMISAMKRYGDEVAVTVHGSILPNAPEWYYERYSMYPFQKPLERDRFVNLIGSGTFAFHTDTLKVSSEDFFPDVMVDLQFSILAKQQCVPLVAVKRPEKWLIALVQGEGLYQDFLFRKTIHTEKVIEHSPWGFSVYADIISDKLDKWKESIDFDVRSEYVDAEVFQAIGEGSAPKNWSESDLYRAKIEERKFVKEPMRKLKQLKRVADRREKDSIELRRLKNSRVYKLFFYLARAIKYPGMETLKFPVRFVKLIIGK